MSELLIELFCEEIPARMQARAEEELKAALEAHLRKAGLSFDAGFAWSGPRRLGVCLQGLSARSEDVREERKGPKVGAPDKAIEGFLRGAGLKSLDEAEIRTDPKKGEIHVAVIETPGRAATDIIAEAVPAIIRGFRWPKSMRSDTRELRWVRPLQRITCVLDGAVVAFEVDGIASANLTEGHRVHGRGPFKVTGWADYRAQLEEVGHVRLTRTDRRAHIAEAAAKLCKTKRLALVEDPGLLEEVTGLAEWPVVVLGKMDPGFLTLPPEVIRLSMRTHQKYFAVKKPKTGELAPWFVLVANIEARDGGAEIAAGNARVLSARLEDARFFWEADRRTGLDAMAAKLGTIAFKEALGTIGDKVERVAALARALAAQVGADPELAERAARLAKADLVSEMVGEFPELQGVMGRYYALEAGEPEAVAEAIAGHYKPQGPADAVPTAPVSIAVALADKLDTLVGFWAINEKPTGSKDPFALRRAALGVARIVLENDCRVRLHRRVSKTAGIFFAFLPETCRESWAAFAKMLASDPDHHGESILIEEEPKSAEDTLADDLLAFFADRLKQVLRDQGKRHDLIDAVFALGAPQSGEAGERPPGGQAAPAEAPAQPTTAVSANDDLVLITRRVEALTGFLATQDGANLLAGYKRAANILAAEEKKDDTRFAGAPEPALFEDKVEHALHDEIKDARAGVEAALEREDFEDAMAQLARLREPVDTFFETVLVNHENPAIRRNRLLILSAIRDALHGVADFSRIEG